MGLFDKKYCSICGEKIGFLGGMLGIRDLKDGHLCKDCGSKLSPFFSEKGASTVEQIKAQLAYREDNKKDVAAFHTTRVLGNDKKLYLDEDARKFMVCGEKNLAEANPDVIAFSAVTGCRLDVRESRSEEKEKKSDGTEVSYNPPHFVYSYYFTIRLTLNHPYISEISFDLNRSSVELHAIEMTGMLGYLKTQDAGYQSYQKLGEEICEIFNKARTEAREQAASANAPKQASVCPACGATTFPDAHGCCEYCGSPLGK